MSKDERWFDLHLSPERARTMNRAGYYAARSWLRQVRRLLHFRYQHARVDENLPNVIHFPAVDDIDIRTGRLKGASA